MSFVCCHGDDYLPMPKSHIAVASLSVRLFSCGADVFLDCRELLIRLEASLRKLSCLSLGDMLDISYNKKVNAAANSFTSCRCIQNRCALNQMGRGILSAGAWRGSLVLAFV